MPKTAIFSIFSTNFIKNKGLYAIIRVSLEEKKR